MIRLTSLFSKNQTNTNVDTIMKVNTNLSEKYSWIKIPGIEI